MAFEFFGYVLLAVMVPTTIAFFLVKKRHRGTVLRIAGAILTVLGFWIAALPTSTGCGVWLLGMFCGPFVAAAAIAISVCLPRTRFVNAILLGLLVFAPFAGVLAGSGVHESNASSCL